MAPAPDGGAAAGAPQAPPAPALLSSPLVPLAGLALALFLLAHLAMLSLALVNAGAFEALAAALHGRLWLPPLELALAALFLAHPIAALLRLVRNRRARGPAAGPLRSRRGAGLEGLAALAARWIPWSGAVLLVFLPLHLVQLRLHRPAAGAELATLLAALASPATALLYALAGLAVGLHLLHGHESAHRSLGWLEPANRGRIRSLGRAIALGLGAGFALLPFALLLVARPAPGP